MSLSSAANPQKIPVSLGKPSLRLRLEAYYSLVSPDVLSDLAAWRSKFDLIYDKFGGTHEKERRLALKLAKKYGSTVKLHLAESATTDPASNVDTAKKQDEEWYDLRPTEKGSGVLDFTSSSFDPVAALVASENDVRNMNPWITNGPLLDHVDQFRTQLPECDPLRRSLTTIRKRDRESDNVSTESSKRPKQLPAFAQLAADFEKGPFCVLHTAFVKRQRIRVLIRYVNGIRGTLTGYLLAFDKHFNMILRDVDEVYSPCISSSNLSNIERELRRRQSAVMNNDEKHEWNVRERHMKQMMVRGDNVVLVYKAETEQSAWPRTSKSPGASIYRTKDAPSESRVGTPGSLIYAYHRRQRQKET
jgi:small nuclear ribonucleoprotein (snRNP)-like protein